MKTCRYCLNPAELVKFAEDGYPYERDYGPVWLCRKDGAWVGCHKGTENALGGLANAELRAAKMAAHAAFDPLWKRKMEREQCSKSQARKAGYRWLAAEMGLPKSLTHIGYMSLEECQKVVALCEAIRKKP